MQRKLGAMTTAIVFIAIAAFLVYGLDRNHRKQPHTRLAGITDVVDRDAARTLAELRAATDRPIATRQRATARRAARVRLAIGSR